MCRISMSNLPSTLPLFIFPYQKNIFVSTKKTAINPAGRQISRRSSKTFPSRLCWRLENQRLIKLHLIKSKAATPTNIWKRRWPEASLQCSIYPGLQGCIETSCESLSPLRKDKFGEESFGYPRKERHFSRMNPNSQL
jgi:hypothetical protein